MAKRRVLVTGATRFVGAALCPLPSEKGWWPVTTTRQSTASNGESAAR